MRLNLMDCRDVFPTRNYYKGSQFHSLTPFPSWPQNALCGLSSPFLLFAPFVSVRN